MVGIADGAHIAALGADKRGDQELDPRILERARSSSMTSASAARMAKSTSPSLPAF
jgi:ornithine cyclodeaminase/alanine dehydrogenase-like protein (mu-crystallin family)